MKKLLVAAAIASALGTVLPAHATLGPFVSNTITFDPFGTGGANAIQVNTFDWAPDNGLSINVYGQTPTVIDPILGVGKVVQLVAQGKLAVFVKPGNLFQAAPVGEFTFQASFYEEVFGVGAASVASREAAGQPSTFDIYWHPTVCSDQITGANYGIGDASCGAGVNIAHGVLAGLSGAYTCNQGQPAGACLALDPVPPLLDSNGTDNQHGTLTTRGNGSTTVQVNLLSQNSNFFISNVISLAIDLQDTTNTAVPFAQADPSDQVFGFTPYYSLTPDGLRYNGYSNGPLCRNGGQTELDINGSRCDLHLQTDASSSFQATAVPEPASLALFGIALAGLGLSRRRKTA